MRFVALAPLVALAAVGCTPGPPSAQISPLTAPPSTAATAVAGGCGSTQVFKGGVPAWLDAAGAYNNPAGLPYVVANPPIAAGFLFGAPLRAGHPTNPANKILWVVGKPREGAELRIIGHPLEASTPEVQTSAPAGSSPGEIYPSIVDVPRPGCWRFDLYWAGHTAAAELLYT
ncbi:MAG: hypothetical protein E6J18_07090 [Chloroflexi bacterium]|nr:MAG: hypothetical protein E6J18_07090 [Chloroflexota bacterium]